MAFIEQTDGQLATYVTSVNVTAVSVSITNGVPTYSSGGIRQFCAVIRDVATGNPKDVTLAGIAAGTIPVGVSQDFGQYGAVGPGAPIQVAVSGTCKARAASAITVGQQVYVGDASGRMATAPAAGATSAYIVGIAETAATEADDIFSVRLLIGASTFVNA